MITFSEFGGSFHSRRTDAFNGIPFMLVTRAGAPRVVYSGVQSLKYIIPGRRDECGGGADIKKLRFSLSSFK